MKNFIFVSPNFPDNYWKFCRHLKNDGFNVLGIGDCPYDRLTAELKRSLTEYYKVGDLENYEEVYRAVAFFIFKYGKPDFIESNNEYWLERDAMLRTAFNVTSGFNVGNIRGIKYKSEMKKFYKKAGVKTAEYCLVESLAECRKFVKKVGFPVIVKPDNGVGANNTYKLDSEEQLEEFLSTSPRGYIMEEYIDGEVNSYDAIVDGEGNPVFETGNVTPRSLMDIVNSSDDSLYYILNKPFDDVRDAGRRTLKAYGVKNRFIHFEFFRLLKDQRIGKKGEVVALEVNMRPSGGISPDMMNYANSTDVYKIWADVMAFGKSSVATGEKFYCAFAGRRDGKSYFYTEQDIVDKYKKHIKTVGRVPKALSGAMGNTMYLAAFSRKEELETFYRDVFLPS